MNVVPVQPIQTPGRRHTPRFSIMVPVSVTVLRSGVPEGVPGRSVDVGEGGLCAVIAGELFPGETVGVEFRLPHLSLSVLAKARISYHDRLRYGMQFLGLSAEQRSSIRYWAERTGQKRTLAEVEEDDPKAVFESDDPESLRLVEAPNGLVRRSEESFFEPGWERGSGRKGRWDRYAPLVFILICVTIAGGMAWWHWQQGWQELEGRLIDRKETDRAPVRVAPETMQRLLVHKVDPMPPELVGTSRVTGVVVLDTVIGSDGAVVSLRPVSGPDTLARAAMDAVRWWRFEPYQQNGIPVDAETMLAIEFP